MSTLETLKKIWDISTEKFNNIDNNKKKIWFNKLIDGLEENTSIKWMQEKRNSMNDEQKMELYNINPTRIIEILKRWSPIYQLYNTIVNWIKNTSKHWWKNALKYSFLKQIPCRFFVELGILDKPKSLNKDKLVEDIKKDAKNFNINLKICEVVCTRIPEAQAAVPFIEMAKQYTKWYRDHWAEVVIQRIKNEKNVNIEQQTCKELAGVMWGIQNENKAA